MSFFCSYCDESDPAYCYCTPLSRALDDAFNNLYSKGYKMRVLENNNLNEMAQFIFESNKKQGWWPDDVNERNKGEILALVHSEISEALEGLRKNLNDDHLPARPMIEVELADAVIRILDMCGLMVMT